MERTSGQSPSLYMCWQIDRCSEEDAPENYRRKVPFQVDSSRVLSENLGFNGSDIDHGIDSYRSTLHSLPLILNSIHPPLRLILPSQPLDFLNLRIVFPCRLYITLQLRFLCIPSLLHYAAAAQIQGNSCPPTMLGLGFYQLQNPHGGPSVWQP